MTSAFTQLLRLWCFLFAVLCGVSGYAQDTLIGVNKFGNNSDGTVFSLKTDGSAYKVNYAFPQYQNPGSQPFESPIPYNGKLYGLTSGSGFDDIYSFDPATGAYEALYKLPQDDAAPYGTMVVDGSLLYGFTSAGGANDAGMIFSYDPAKTGAAGFTDLFDFDGNNSGSLPTGTPLLYNGMLYGMTYQGGTDGAGTVFRFDPSKTGSAGFTKLYDFDGANNGGNPYGNLIVYSGKLYSMTTAGGIDGYGIIFSYDPDQTGTAGFAKLLDFDGNALGGSPFGSFTVYNNKLYSMTYSGGADGAGIIFSFDPASSTFQSLYTFDGITAGTPVKSDLYLYNNIFYGMCQAGGSNNSGVLFSYDPSKSGNAAFSPLVSLGNTNGYSPYGHVVAYNNLLYGVNWNSGSGNGTFFSYDPTSNAYAVLVDFNEAAVDDGPTALVKIQDKLYGTTSNNSTPPTIFSYDPVKNDFEHLYTFELGTSPGTLAALGNSFYGASDAFSVMYLFRYNTLSNQFDTVSKFNDPGSTIGSYVTEYNGKVYGFVNGGGGANGLGYIYAYDTATGATVHLFDQTTSLQVYSPLTIYNNKLYGYNANTIFALDLNTHTATNVYTFPTTNGVTPALTANLVGRGGSIYGNTGNDGANQDGTIFAIDTATKKYTKLYDLSSTTGYGTPGGNGGYMITDSSKVYGVFSSGTVFTFDPSVNNSLKVLHTFGGTGDEGGTPVALLVYATPKTPKITFANLTKTYGDADFAPGATSTNSSTPIVYASMDTTIAKVTPAGLLHLLKAGSVKIIASQAGSDRFIAASDTVTLTVNKAPLTISARDTLILTGKAIPAFTITYTTLVNGDTPAALGGTVTATTTATSGSPAGNYPITVTGPATAANYTITYKNAQLTLSNGAPIITFNSLPSQLTYGAPAFNPAASANSGTTPTYTSSDPTVATIVPGGLVQVTGVGTVTITASFAAGNGFNSGSAMQTLTVNKAPLIITAQNANWVYQGQEPAFGATYTGFVYNDNAGSLISPPQFTTTATASSLPGVYPIDVCCAASPNYTITYVSGNLTVIGNQTVTFPPLSVMTYGDAPFDPGAVSNTGLPATYTTDNPYVAVVANGKINITGAGTATITATFSTSGNSITTSSSQVLTVKPKQLTIIADNVSKDQGQANPPLTASYNGFVNGDTYLDLGAQPVLTTTATVESPIGNYPITVSGAAAFNGNYTIGYVDGTLYVVTPRGLTFGALPDKTYGDADFSADVTSLTPETVQYASSDSSVAIVTGGNIHITGAGMTTISAILPADQNYPVATSVTQTLSVAPASLMVTANNQTKAFGQANPPLTMYYDGFVNGDDSTALSALPVPVTTVQTGTDPGQYPITVSGGQARNYTLLYVAGTFTVTPLTGENANGLSVVQHGRSELDVNLYLVDQEPVSILLYDMNGKLLSNNRPPLYSGFNTYPLEIGNIPTGVYIVKAAGKGWSLQQKVLIH